VRLHDGQRCHQQLDASFGKVVRCLHDVAVRNLEHIEAGAFKETEQQEIGVAVGGSRIELTRVGTCERYDLADRAELERRGRRDRQHDRRDAGDRHEIALGIVRQLLVLVGMHREGSGRRP